MDLRLEDSACVVVGGSSGIGLACAQLLVEEGAAVLLVGREEGRLREAADACAGGPGEAGWLALDVLEESAGEALAEAVAERFGGLRALVYSAGSSATADLERAEDSLWRRQWELNVVAPARLIDALAPAMGPGSAIVAIGSSAGRRPSSRDAPYAVAKRGQLALTEVYAERLGPAGIRVNAVAPGPTETPLWTREGGLLDELAAETGEDRAGALARAGERLPAGRLARSQEVAAAVAMLVAGATVPSGAVWSVDGGHVPDVF